MRPMIAALACSLFTAFAVASPQSTAARASTSPLAGLSFLIGEWRASGAGQPGRSVGEFSFESVADGHALLRRNESATATGHHTDILLVFADQDGSLHATYVDNEGHTIHYGVRLEADPQKAIFESSGPGPRFRLWYRANRDGSVATGFEMASPGSSEFRTYLEGVAHRR